MAQKSYLKTVQEAVVLKKVKDGNITYKTSRGKVLSEDEVQISKFGFNEDNNRRKYRREKFAYDNAFPILPEGLDFKVEFFGMYNEIRITIFDKISGVDVVSSDLRNIPTNKEEMGKTLSDMFDNMVIPTFNPLEYVNGTN